MGNVKCFAVSPAKRKRLYHGIEECVKFFELFIYRTIGTIIFIRLFRQLAPYPGQILKKRKTNAPSRSQKKKTGKKAVLVKQESADPNNRPEKHQKNVSATCAPLAIKSNARWQIVQLFYCSQHIAELRNVLNQLNPLTKIGNTDECDETRYGKTDLLRPKIDFFSERCQTYRNLVTSIQLSLKLLETIS